MLNSKIDSKLSSMSEAVADFKSYLEAKDTTEPKFCASCGEECREGQQLWNGWFIYEDLYHFQCIPERLKERIGLKV